MKRFFRLPWRTARDISTDIEAELRFHMEERMARLIALGSDPKAARAQAEREFGDVDDARRYINSLDRQTEREHRRREFLGDLRQDVAYAMRSLRKSPTFAVAVLLTLALGIGANTAVFNLVDGVLFRPPNVGDASNVAWISPLNREGRSSGWTMPDVVAYRTASRSWSHLSAFGNVWLTLNSDEPTRLSGLAVNGDYFDVMGLRPSLGRGFLAYEDSASAPVMSIVIGYALWQSRFGGDSSVIGRVVRINAQPMTIVGVAPQGFNGMRLGDQLDLWIPFPAITRLRIGHGDLYTAAQSRWLSVNARLAPGVTRAEAQAEAAVIEKRLESWITKPEERRTLDVAPIRGGIEPSARSRLTLLFSLIMLVPVLVLCVACANIANLFMSRGVLRQRELAVRRALGASRGRLIRQLLTECGILGLAAGVLGIAMSIGLTALIVRFGGLDAEDVAFLSHPDWRVFAATFALALVASALFGLLPTLTATGRSITPALKNDGIAIQWGRGRHRLRSAFVIGQVALSLSLLITAGLFLGSLRKALDVDPGYDPTNMIAASYDISGQGYTPEQVRRFDAALAEVASSMPGVLSAAVVEVLPLGNGSSSTNLRRDDEARNAPGHLTFTNRVTPGYFDAMRIPIVRGRALTKSDDASAPRVMVVNERLAGVLWPDQDAIGKRVRSPHDSGFVEIVGVARNGKYRSLAEPVQQSAYWLASTQFPMGTHGELVVRSSTGLGDAVTAARAALRAVDPTLPVGKVQALQAYIRETVAGQRAGAALLAVFGAIALSLAAFGIFAVIAQGVAARTREIGIRMSLGAHASDVVRSFVREGLGLTAIGATVGVLLSLGVSKLLAAMLFGLTPTDALTFVGASVAIVGVAAVASFVPARRAAKVDPLIALRSD